MASYVTTASTTWGQWTNLTPTYATGSTSTTWTAWMTSTTSTPLTWQQNVWDDWQAQDYVYRRNHNWLTAEERDELQRAREQRSREELARRQALETKLAEARPRARQLLEDLVSAEEWAPSMRGMDLIQLEGSDGKLYRIELHRRTVHGNIVEVDKHGCLLGRACVAPQMYDGVEVLPTEDGWVGQYLGLKYDAREFLSRANWSDTRTGCLVGPALTGLEAA